MGNKIIKVEPLRTKEEISDFIQALETSLLNSKKKVKNELTSKEYHLLKRNNLMFLVGINTGLRIGDILRLKVKDVKNKESIVIYEEKTSKRREVDLYTIRHVINDYIAGMQEDEYLFKSQKGNKPISKVQAYRVLQAAADVLERDDIGTHTMRKTYGYHHYKQNKDVVMLQKTLNHSSPSVTLDYIGITRDEMRESTRRVSLGV